MIVLLYRRYLDVHPRTPEERTSLQDSLKALDDVNILRAERIQASGSSLHPVFWLVLILGAVLTIGFSFFFYLENVWVQILMTSALVGTIASLFFLLLVLDHPFTGDIHVTSESFVYALEHMRD